MNQNSPVLSVAKGPARPATVWTSAGAPQRNDEGLGTLAEALDRILCKGVAVDGEVTIGVAGVELILLDLRLLLAAVDTVQPDGSFFSGLPATSGPTLPPASAPALPSPPPPAPAPLSAQPARAPVPASPPPGNPLPGNSPPGNSGNRGSEAPSGLSLAGDSPGLFDGLEERKGPQQGLVRLVLTLVNLLHEVLERQAVRRMDNGTLTSQQTENIGTALYAQAMEIARLREQFGLSDGDLTLRISASG